MQSLESLPGLIAEPDEDFHVPTFKEQLDKITGLQHRLAVWGSIYAYIEENFASKDSGKPKMALKAPGCIVDRVPEDVIDEVLQELAEQHIEVIKEEIALVESQEVSSPPTPEGN